MKRIARAIKNRLIRTRLGHYGIILLKHNLYKSYFSLHRLPKRQTKYYFSAVLIFKDEDRYLKEWIEYHKLIGVDHIYAYNDGSTDNYLEVLIPYIEVGYVTLVEWKKPHSQMEAYSDCLDRFKGETYWMSFIDIDEFICLYQNHSIVEWMRPYEKYCSVVLLWRQFSTGGIMYYDSTKLVTERFIKASPSLRDIGKIVLNTSFLPVQMCHHCIECRVHFAGRDWIVPSITEDKNFIMEYSDQLKIHVRKIPTKNTIQLNHYWSKSYEEYRRKMDKGDVTYVVDRFGRETQETFVKFENLCTSEDYTITRLLPALKKQLGMIS